MNPDIQIIVQALDRLTAANQKGIWDYVGISAIVLTLIVLVWYTVETYLLRKAAQEQLTNSSMPILSFHSSRRDGAPD